jgi:hypothetical protein
MTDITDMLRQVELARISAMSRKQKIKYLRDAGWRRVTHGKGQRWRAVNGYEATIDAAAWTQVLADLETMVR